MRAKASAKTQQPNKYADIILYIFFTCKCTIRGRQPVRARNQRKEASAKRPALPPIAAQGVGGGASGVLRETYFFQKNEKCTKKIMKNMFATENKSRATQKICCIRIAIAIGGDISPWRD